MKWALGVLAVMAAAVAQAGEAPTYIGGTAPDHRREDAPVIKQVPLLDKKVAFRGVVEPYPTALDAIAKDQGAWYTPFTRPGMVGRYDIRGYHQK